MRVELSVQTLGGLSVRAIGTGYIEYEGGKPWLTLPCHNEKDFNHEIDLLIRDLTALKGKAKFHFEKRNSL